MNIPFFEQARKDLFREPEDQIMPTYGGVGAPGFVLGSRNPDARAVFSSRFFSSVAMMEMWRVS